MDSQLAHQLAEDPAASPDFLLRLLPAPRAEGGMPASEVWARICQGNWRIDEHRGVEDGTQLALRIQSTPAHVVADKRLHMLTRVLAGHSQSSVALECGVAASTVCANFQAALATLGLPTRLSAVPVFLAQLSHAAETEAILRVRDGRFDDPGDGYVTVLLPRYGEHLPGMLSPGELSVCHLLLRGCTYREIALARGTAQRTVANQLRAIFSKLRVCGRLDVIVKLATESVR
jgi:DNA-binding CsgD family transcriptional regulator